MRRIESMPELYSIKPIGHVANERTMISDDFWGSVTSRIQLTVEFGEDSLKGISAFSHVEILFLMHRSPKVQSGKCTPRENLDWPEMGIFAQRKKDRPNHIGSTIVELISCEANAITVRGLDAVDTTPVLDIKPVFREFLPRDVVTQPDWVGELMQQYWE